MFSEFEVKSKISRKGAKTQRRMEESLGWGLDRDALGKRVSWREEGLGCG